MNRRQKRIILLLVLVIGALLLSGCGGVTTETNAAGEEITVYTGGVFEVLAQYLRAAVVFFHDNLLTRIGVVYAWGWAIILVALVIRLLLLPLGLRQMRSMREAQAKMKLIQPDLDRLKKKYAKDKQKLQEEQMKLYQQHGITQAQMAGCLPTLLQMPILFAFYYAILGLAADAGVPDSGRLQNEPFYFIPDISKPSYREGLSWLISDFTIDKLISPDVWPYLVLPALLAITQYAMIKTGQMGQPPQGDSDGNPAAGMMGQMTWLMTGMFVFFALQVPSGLSLYWVVGNVLALLQQVYVNRQKDSWEQNMAVEVAATSSAAAAEDDAEVEPKKSPERSKATPSTGSGTRRKRRKRR